MRCPTTRLSSLCALSLVSLVELRSSVYGFTPNRFGETAALRDRLGVDSLAEAVPTRKSVWNREATGSSVSEVTAGKKVEAQSKTVSKARITEDTEIVRNQTGKVAETEDTTATSEEKTKSAGKDAKATAKIQSTVTTTARVTSRKSSTRMVRLPDAVNKTEAEVEKKIEDALSGALFEASKGSDVTIETSRMVDVITSAYADLMVAAGTTAESEDGDEVCSEVITKIAPQTVTASVKTALEESIGGSLPVTVEMKLKKLEQATVEFDGESKASTCAELGKSDAQSILTSSAYKETVSSIVEDIIIIAKDSVVKEKSKVDVKSESTEEFVDVYAESESVSEGKSSSGADVSGGTSAETVTYGASEKKKSHLTEETEKTTHFEKGGTGGQGKGKDTVTTKEKAKKTKTAELEREAFAKKETKKPGTAEPEIEMATTREKAKSQKTVETEKEVKKPVTETPAEPSSEGFTAAQIPHHQTTKDVDEILSGFAKSTVGKRAKAEEEKAPKKEDKRIEQGVLETRKPEGKTAKDIDDVLKELPTGPSEKHEKGKESKRPSSKTDFPSTEVPVSKPRSSKDIDDLVAGITTETRGKPSSPSKFKPPVRSPASDDVGYMTPLTSRVKSKQDIDAVLAQLHGATTEPLVPSSTSSAFQKGTKETPEFELKSFADGKLRCSSGAAPRVWILNSGCSRS